MRKTFEAYATSHIGLSRKKNEDSWFIHDEPPFFALADGLGGHNAGEVASKETLIHLRQSIENALALGKLIKDELQTAICQANCWVNHLGQVHKECEGMGSTLCCALLQHETLIYAHVGDSRIYRLRDNQFNQLTKDHCHPPRKKRKGPLAKAIGPEPIVEPEVGSTEIAPGDLYLLCSDGLTDYVSEETILFRLKQKELSLREVSENLMEEAIAGGGGDNITTILIKTT